ncbi:MAG TPA: protein-L-isoaspartate(D-aspartate) O-methyltransferase [Pirellulaceae bacterium]|nr:protein-L-isoaspartate(D-aspartate) O-methyltransferase [Pirellulaceae bacterium]
MALAALALLGRPAPSPAQSGGSYEQQRKRLVDEVLAPAGITSPRVLDAARRTPRHEFVAEAHRKNAYFDMALPIGEHQTISSPFIVAYMTQSLDPQPTDKVLEIGTGSGYQAAILSPLVKSVYSIEIVEPLGLTARDTLKRLKYDNVFTRIGDGFQGWPEHAPYDKIIVTCSPEKVPQPLIDQLVEGGLMVVPVGERYQQTLYLYRKEQGRLAAAVLRPTLFVPMTGRAEDAREVLPDPKHPRLVNANFEQPPPPGGKFVAGWYYEQQVTWEADSSAPEGGHYIRFRNQTPGRSAHVLQGLAIDGRAVPYVRVSAMVKLDRVQAGPEREELPHVAMTFYDENRKEVSRVWIGPLRGTKDWHRVADKFKVPKTAREAIVRLGLFGATGEACFDDIKFIAEDK